MQEDDNSARVKISYILLYRLPIIRPEAAAISYELSSFGPMQQ